MKNPRNQILYAIAEALRPLQENGDVKEIAVSLAYSKDTAPFISVRSGVESVEQIDTETYQRELLAVCQVTVDADDDAINILDKIAFLIEEHVLAASYSSDLNIQVLQLAETQFPDLPGEQMVAAAMVFRVIYQTPLIQY